MPSTARVLSVLAVVSGAALLAAGAWFRPLIDGQQAVRASDLELALGRYAAAEARFDRLPFTKRLLPGSYEASVANQLWLRYRLKQYDALIDKAAGSPSSAPVHFWTACAFYEKARVEDDPESRVSWLGRAVEEFRQALEHAPDSWDTKYNYELATRLLVQIEQQPKAPQKQLMELLRPVPTPPGQSPRPVG